MAHARRLGVALAVLLGAGAVGASLAAAQGAATRRRSREPERSTRRLIVELDQLLKEQRELLQATEALKREVDIVKVRASTIPSGICD